MIYLHDINPIAFSFGRLQVHWYGLMYLAGFTCAWFLGRYRIAQNRLPGIQYEGFADLLFYAMSGVVIGGRVGYMLFYAPEQWMAHPLDVFKIWQGGMSFHGGVLGVLIASAIWSRKYRIAYIDCVDFLAPLVPLGLCFGRLGNFIGGELWGKWTHANWGVIFPRAPELADTPMNVIRREYAENLLNRFARHPSQLYEAALEGVVLFTVLWVVSIRPCPRYLVSGLFALLYGIFRFLLEFVRMPDNGVYVAFGWLTRGQILSVPLILVGIAFIALSQRATASSAFEMKKKS